MAHKGKIRLQFALVLLLGIVSGVIAYPKAVSFAPPVSEWIEKTFKVNLGLDLQGGIHLEYKADVSQIESGKVNDALAAAEAVIERRVNAFGVGEPLVQLARSGTEHRIIVELPGVKDVEQAKKMIKETPFLEFREPAGPEVEQQFEDFNNQNHERAKDVLIRALADQDFALLVKENSEDPGSKGNGGEMDFAKPGTFVPEFDKVVFDEKFEKGSVWPELVESQFGWHIIKKIDERGEGENREVKAAHILLAKRSIDQYPQMKFKATGLSGKNLKDAYVDYQSQGIGSPQIALRFDDEGAKLFADITRRNIGKPVAIFLDGQIISQPTVQAEILGGQAVITGRFTMQEANDLVKRFNEGALPVPITLVSQQSIDASLGEAALKQSLFAGAMGLLAVAIFMMVYYRFLGLIAVVALLLYTAMLLALFKLSILTPFAITLTLSGIAGFVLSIGMAVDANVLIFERTREELAYGKNIYKALDEGFRRAWPSIRDGNYSTLITTFILIAMGTGFVKGFAIILTLGVLLSMFTAVVLVRVTLRFLVSSWAEKYSWIVVPTGKRFDEN